MFWWELMEHAAKAGITEAEYWESSPRYVTARIRAHRSDQQHEYENAWERARLTAWASMVPRDTRRKLRKPQDLIKFPWEKGKLVGVEMDEATRKVMQERLDEEARKFFGTSPPGPLSNREGVTSRLGICN